MRSRSSFCRPGHQRQRDDQRHHADRHADRGDQRDDRDEHLPPLGQQVAERDLQLEWHALSRRRGRISGNRMTSRIDGEFGEEHHQPIDADALAAGRRHAVLERPDVVLVHGVRLGVALRALGELRLEAAALLGRIVELAEGVGHFEAADVELEALDGVGIVRALLRQRRDLGREVVDERRLDQLMLPRAARRSRWPPCRRRRPATTSMPRRPAIARAESTLRSSSVDTVTPSRRDASSAAACRSDSRRNGACRLISCSPNVSCSVPIGGAGHERQQLLGEAHQHLVVHVGPVELEHRELGVVLRRDPLVAEVAVDLEHPLDAADRQPLQVQLRRDAQVQLHVERVVVRHEGTRQRAAGDRLHHRRLDFEEAAGWSGSRAPPSRSGCGSRTPGARRG